MCIRDSSKEDEKIKRFITKYQKQKLSEETSAKVEKDGVVTGKYCLHPISQKKIPIWIANYILDNYGNGVVMGVPAHDPRDYDFAEKFDLEIESKEFMPTFRSLVLSGPNVVFIGR